MCREDLDRRAEEDERLEVHYVLSTPPEGWVGSQGRCNKAIFEQHLFPAADDCLALICGPPAMEVSHGPRAQGLPGQGDRVC